MRLALPCLALVVVAARAGAQCPDGTPMPCGRPRSGPPAVRIPPPDARARSFLLLPFRNVTRGIPQDWLITGAPLMLGDALGQFQDLRVVPEERLAAARRRLGIAPDVTLDAEQIS